MTQGDTRASNEHREKLMDYIYQELEPEAVKAFERHLPECRMCQRDLADFRRVRQALASWELEGVPHISLTVDPPPRRRWFDLFQAVPLWMRLAATAAAAMLLMALFNLQLSYIPGGGFRVSASLLPRPRATQPRVTGLTEQQVNALIEQALAQAQQQRDEQMAVQLDALASRIRSENQHAMTKLARSLREQQESRLAELWEQTQESYHVLTLADLFQEESGNGY